MKRLRRASRQLVRKQKSSASRIKQKRRAAARAHQYRSSGFPAQTHSPPDLREPSTGECAGDDSKTKTGYFPAE